MRGIFNSSSIQNEQVGLQNHFWFTANLTFQVIIVYCYRFLETFSLQLKNQYNMLPRQLLPPVSTFLRKGKKSGCKLCFSPWNSTMLKDIYIFNSFLSSSFLTLNITLLSLEYFLLVGAHVTKCILLIIYIKWIL